MYRINLFGSLTVMAMAVIGAAALFSWLGGFR
jgi:hypothetical protein